MLKKIQILIPEETNKRKYFDEFLDEWGEIENRGKGIPKIEFNKSKGNDPKVIFCDDSISQKHFDVGKMELGINITAKESKKELRLQPKVEVLSDTNGGYLLVKWPNNSYYQMDLEQLYQRLHGHIKWLDHVGINVNPLLMGKDKYNNLLSSLAKSTFLIASPVNNKWIFVVPKAKEIGQLFELVGDFKFNYPEIQIDIQTDLSAKEVINMFPLPYGYHDPDPVREDYCVRIFIYTGWKNTSLRVDIRFQLADPNWKWKEWLLEEGKRII